MTARKTQEKAIESVMEVASMPRPVFDELVGLLEVAVVELEYAVLYHQQKAAVDTTGGILERQRWDHARRAEDTRATGRKLAFWLAALKK